MNKTRKTHSAGKAAWLVLATLILVLVAVVPCAHATIIDGTLNFDVSDGGPAPTGSFVWNSNSQKFSSLTVSWDGALFDFAKNSPGATLDNLANGHGWCAAGPSASYLYCPPALFALGYINTILPESSSFFSDLYATAQGFYTVTETVATPTVATPEPNSLGMMLLGLVLFAILWTLKRMLSMPRWGAGLPANTNLR